MELNVTISGSYRKYPEAVASAISAFQDNKANVLSPRSMNIISSLDGFVTLQGDVVERLDLLSPDDIVAAMRDIEDSHLQAIQQSDLLWLVLKDQYCGPATAFETGWAIAHGIPVYSDAVKTNKEPLVKAYVQPAKDIASLVAEFDPAKVMYINPEIGKRLVRSMINKVAPLNSTIAVGAVIEDHSKRYRSGQQRDIVLVDDSRWEGKFTLVGGKRRGNESLAETLRREMLQKTGLEGGAANHICTFEELQNAGYAGEFTERIFVDYCCPVTDMSLVAGDEIREVARMPAAIALRDLPIEPNARKTVEEYAASQVLI